MTSAKTTIKQMHAAQQTVYRANFALGEKIDALEAENDRLREALKRMLLEFDFMIKAKIIPDIRSDIIFVEARTALGDTQ